MLLFGGLGAIVAGDRLQLFPVRRLVSAFPADGVGNINHAGDEAVPGGEETGEVGHVHTDAGLGHVLCRMRSTVAILFHNVRCSGMIATMSQGTRAGCISDVHWDVLVERLAVPSSSGSFCVGFRFRESYFSCNGADVIARGRVLRAPFATEWVCTWPASTSV